MSEELALSEQSREELEQQLLVEQDPDKVKEIINVFSMNLKKKEAIRTNQLSDMQDKVFDQMDKRLTSKSDNFSNTDLITYYKTIQDSLAKANTAIDQMEIPKIQVNQQININTEDALDRASRQRVLDVVNSIIARSSQVTEQVATNLIEDTTIQEEVVEEEK